MKEIIEIAPNTYIEYEIENECIIPSSLYIVHNGRKDSKLNNVYNKGILACLIEARLRKEGCSAKDIVDKSWPINQKPSEDYDYERNVRERISKLRNSLKKLIGEEKTLALLPNKQRGCDYEIIIPSEIQGLAGLAAGLKGIIEEEDK